jgi:hypothetical protein
VRGCLGGAARCSVRIERAAHPAPAALQHMRVDHGRTDVLVPQELLHRPNDVAGGRETVRPMLERAKARIQDAAYATANCSKFW